MKKKMKCKNENRIRVFVFFAGILFVIWWLMRTSKSVPGEKFAREFLIRKVGGDQTQVLLRQFRTNYWNLYHHRQIPKNRILHFHLNQAILPVLAFYQVLLPINDGDKQKTIKEIEDVVRIWILRKTRFLISPLRFFNHPFKIFRPGFEMVMKLFPPAGFEIDYLEKSEERVAFDIKGCFFLKTLRNYGVPELTPVFCAADEAMAELFPPSIGFKRTQTLGKGGDLCDFRYCLLKRKES